MEFNSSEFFTTEFNVFRKDGFAATESGVSGRGVLIAVRTTFDCSVFVIPNTENIDILCVKIVINNGIIVKNVFVLCCYVHPNSPIETYQLLFDAIDFLSDSIQLHDDILVLGDFNFPHLIWTQSDDSTHFTASNASTPKEISFVDNMLNSGLLQTSNTKNCLDRQLDLVFSSDVNSTIVSETALILSTLDNYHPPIQITFCCEHSGIDTDCDASYRFNFRRADYNKLNELLTNVDFNAILQRNSDIDINTTNFYSVIFECLEQSVPYISSKNTVSSPPWYNRELRTLRNLRNKLWHRYLKTDSELIYAEYLNAYNDFSNLSKQLYNDYISSMQSDLIANPKSFWQFVNLKRKSDGYPSTLKYEDSSSNDPNIITNLFAKFFSQGFSSTEFEPDVNYFSYLNNCAQTSLVSIDITRDAVLDGINNLKDDFSSGPDGLPSIVLKKCINSLTGPLTALFQRSLSLGIFPTVWKDSFIVPIHKKGCKSDISNFRPIAKLSCIPKLFESIVYDTLYFHCKSLFSPIQHGFLKGRSTTTNLTEFVSRTINAMELGKEVDVIATDFSKAFDRISHKIILFKLKALGFTPHLLLWVDSYLKDRRYQVLFRSSKSSSFIATSGVPQGSHLGPIMFILSINDVDSVIKNSSISVYADDMKIFKEITATTDVHMLQNDLNDFAIWCEMNHLDLNVNKCQFITYSRKRLNSPQRTYLINNDVVNRVTAIRDLGVMCDNEMNFRLHFANIIGRANSTLGFVKRWSKEFLDPYVTKALYTTLVRPLLEYASQVWSPYHEIHINRIEAVQRRFLRFALRGLPRADNYHLPPYLDRLNLIKLQPLEKRRVVADVVFIHQILSGNIETQALLEKINFNINSRTLRTVPAFRPARHKTGYGQNEPITRMLCEVNLNYAVFDYNISKHTLKKLLYS